MILGMGQDATSLPLSMSSLDLLPLVVVVLVVVVKRNPHPPFVTMHGRETRSTSLM